MMKKGFTIIEMVITLAILSAITIICFQFMDSMFGQYRDMENDSDSLILSMRVVNTLEEAITGCSEIDVKAEQITITSAEGIVIVKASDFKEDADIIFSQNDNYIIIYIGGAEYWVPIVKEM